MELTYTLHASQFKVYNDPARFVVLVAGRRFGKTILAIVKAIMAASREPRARVWYICPTYVQAKMIAWKMLLDVIPQAMLAKKPNEVELSFHLVNGSEISLKGADNEQALRGAGLNFVVMDEFSQMKAHVWQEIIRPMLTDTLGKALFIGTPKGKNHFWELFMKGQRQEVGFSSYQFKTEDNPYIQRSEIVEAKTQLNDRFFRQEYEASFEDYTGLIWPEFNYKDHVINPIEVPAWWEKFGAIDPALSGTTACLFGAVDDSGILHITGEYYEQNKRVSETSDVIRGKCARWYIDPAAQIRSVNRAGSLYSLFDEFSDNGVYTICAENDVDAGINRVAEYFKAGKIRIFNTCRNLLAEIERYHWSEERETVSGVMKPKPYKAFDHAVDCLRYLVMSRAQGAMVPKPKSIDRAMPLAGELLTIDQKKTGLDEWLH